MNYFEFKKSLLEQSIYSNKKLLMFGYSAFILNVLLSTWNIFNLYKGYSHNEWLTGIAIGCTSVSAIWVWISVWDLMCSLKIEREMIAYFDKLIDKNFFEKKA